MLMDAARADSPAWRSLAAPDRARRVIDRQADDIAVLSPGTVIIGDLVAKQARQDEPAMARSLADPAGRDDRLRAVDADLGIELPQLLDRLDRAISLVYCACPGQVDGAWDMAGAERQFLEPSRCDDLARELVGRADVEDAGIRLLFDDIHDIGQPRAQRAVGLGDGEARRLDRCRTGRDRALLQLPFLAATIEQLHVVAQAVDVEHP